MNAQVKTATLEGLYKQRDALLAKVEEIHSSRAKLADLDVEVAGANEALRQFATGEAARMEQWSSHGCRGPRPIADFSTHEKLEHKCFEAEHNANVARSARNALDFREKELGCELHGITQSIKDAVAGRFAKQFEAAGIRANKLRDELAELDAELLAGRAFFVSLAEKFREDHKARNPAFDAVVHHAEAAMEQNDATLARNFDMPERDQLTKIEDQFWALFRGE
jgi:hypothetical protein